MATHRLYVLLFPLKVYLHVCICPFLRCLAEVCTFLLPRPDPVAEEVEAILFPAFQEVLARCAKQIFQQVPSRIVDPNATVHELNAIRHFLYFLPVEMREPYERVLAQRGCVQSQCLRY